MERKISYMFQYENKIKVQSGGNAGVYIYGKVDHEQTKVRDIVEIRQFNLSGSFPFKTKIIEKRSCDWDMSKPLYQRQSYLIIEEKIK